MTDLLNLEPRSASARVKEPKASFELSARQQGNYTYETCECTASSTYFM